MDKRFYELTKGPQPRHARMWLN
uniref:Uncharacterized protein n=1 Tax=Anguilla anguilla TaxID=7936 RepID=A0A0E9SPZ7_ANGAN